jgi:hypothetical protein
MKKILRIAALVIASMAAIASCSLLSGKDGKAFVQVTFDINQADGVMGNFGGLPTDGQVDTEYEVAPQSYTGDYVLYWTGYVSDTHGGVPYSHYHTHFNHAQFFLDWGYIWGSSASSNLSYYTSSFYATYHNDLAYTVTVKEGSFPFRNGADTHFTLYLDWDPTASTISSSAVAASEAKIIEDSADRIVKELTDGDYTLRLEIKKGSVPVPKSLKNMK